MSKEQEVKHTELPWIISTDGNHIAHRDKTGVAIFIKPEDGRFAVYACNRHYALKKENEELRATNQELIYGLIDELNSNKAMAQFGSIETYYQERAEAILSILDKAGITV